MIRFFLVYFWVSKCDFGFAFLSSFIAQIRRYILLSRCEFTQPDIRLYNPPSEVLAAQLVYRKKSRIGKDAQLSKMSTEVDKRLAEPIDRDLAFFTS